LRSHITKAGERIERARERYEQLAESVANYEALVAAQRQQLELLQHRDDYDDELPVPRQVEVVTDEMIEQEEQAIVELERKKEDMEKKIKGIDRKMNSVYQSLRE
jgi:chromosome segregation ATPase